MWLERVRRMSEKRKNEREREGEKKLVSERERG